MIDMPRYRQALEKELESLHPDLRWIAREVVELGGTRWLRMEYTARERETDRHFQMYVTSFRGRTLIVNMQARASEAARWTAEHARVVESIELRDCDLPPEAASRPR